MPNKRTGRYSACQVCGKEIYIHLSRDIPGHKKGMKKYCSLACTRMAWSGSTDPVEAFWLKVDKGTHPKGCWLYTGFLKWDGYGWLARKMDGRNRYMTAHRYAWILKHGEPAAGLSIMHDCDVPACCNPDHLRVGTHAENMADMKAKGRANSWNSKKTILHPDRVRPVRKEIA